MPLGFNKGLSTVLSSSLKISPNNAVKRKKMKTIFSESSTHVAVHEAVKQVCAQEALIPDSGVLVSGQYRLRVRHYAKKKRDHKITFTTGRALTYCHQLPSRWVNEKIWINLANQEETMTFFILRSYYHLPENGEHPTWAAFISFPSIFRSHSAGEISTATEWVTPLFNPETFIWNIPFKSP